MQRFDDQSLSRMQRSISWTERQGVKRNNPGPLDQVGGLFQLVRGRIGTSFTGSSGTFNLKDIVPLGESTPYPGTEIIVVNVHRSSGSINGTAYAVYHYAAKYPGTGTGMGTSEGTGTGDGNWELLTLTSGGDSNPSEATFGCYFKEVPAATISVSGSGTDLSVFCQHGLGTDCVIILEKEGTGFREERSTEGVVRIVDGANFSKTILRASMDQPIILMGALYLMEDENEFEGTGMGTGTGTEGGFGSSSQSWVFFPDNWDMRALPHFVVGSAQIPFTRAGFDSFELGGGTCGTGS